ncbi:MAG: hypothetical protein LBC86_08220 [Oscillospiraceae bacterium]|jgi:hypothetical protein|nr:hypothetical protein [Oscillospiraceae bacterium]
MMGMTDRQFDAHNKTLLRVYEDIRKEIEQLTGGKKSEKLEILIKDTMDSLNRP